MYHHDNSYYDIIQLCCHLLCYIAFGIPYTRKFSPGEKISPISPSALIDKIFIVRIFCPVLMITLRIWRFLQYNSSWTWRNFVQRKFCHIRYIAYYSPGVRVL